MIIPDHPYRVTEDMGDGFLQLMMQEDGDICVLVRQHRPDQNTTGDAASIEFCTRQGGGRHPALLRALRKVIEAIHEDEEHECRK